MKLLLINTCGADGIVALVDGEEMRQELLPGRGASETLVPAIRRLLRDLRVEELDAIGVVHGPGSFTGVRVGLAAAKGLCEAGGVGLIAMSRLALVSGDEGIALLDAGRGEYFFGEYSQGMLITEELLARAAVMSRLEGRAPVTCEPRVAEQFQDARLVEEPGAEAMRAMVLARIAAGEWSDVASIDANYMRRTDAEILVGGK